MHEYSNLLHKLHAIVNVDCGYTDRHAVAKSSSYDANGIKNKALDMCDLCSYIAT